MGLLDGLEKLINEHGSAVILKERIALANDKFAALEQKLAASELRAENLESENHGLRLDNEECQKQRRALEEKLSQRTSERLEKTEESVLVIVSNHDGLSDQKISAIAALEKKRCTFYLHELKAKKFAETSPCLDEDNYMVDSWRITQEGRRYLVSHGLL